MSSNRHQRSLRESLLTALAVGRQMAALIVASNDSPPGEPDRWTARDHLAYIAHYCDYGAAVLDAVRQGLVPPEDAESDIDERNARVLAENRHLAATLVNEWAQESYDRLPAAVEQCSQSDLPEAAICRLRRCCLAGRPRLRLGPCRSALSVLASRT